MIRIIILGYHRQYTIKDVCGTCGVKEARENTTWEAVFGVQIIYKEAWEIVLSHHINNIWIDMETFQHFNKQLGTLHPSWLQDSPPHPPQPPPPNDWCLGNGPVTASFFPFLDSIFLLSSSQGKKIGKGQWEGRLSFLMQASERAPSQQGMGNWSASQEHSGNVCFGHAEGWRQA